jgi:Ca2+-binding RTX toxin-like protein
MLAERRRPGPVRVAIAAVAVSALFAAGASPAGAQVPPTWAYTIPAFVCYDRESGFSTSAVFAYRDQIRLAPTSYEYFDQAVFYWRIDPPGGWVGPKWVPRSILGRPNELILFSAPYIQDSLPPGHYYAGVWYRWWVWNGARWILYEVAPWAGEYWHAGTSNIGPDTRCDTTQRAFNVLVPSVGGIAGSSHSLERSLDSLARASRASATVSAGVVGGRGRARCLGRKATIVGSEGPDVLEGSKGPDVIVGLGGNDSIFAGGGADLVCGGEGKDGILGAGGADRLVGQGGDDTVLGEAKADHIAGEDGFDIIDGGPGNDRLHGGGQDLDILSYLFSPRGVRVDFRGTAVGEGRDTFRGFNAVVGSSHDDTLTGREGEQWFVPLGGDDHVRGGSGADIVVYFLAEQNLSIDLVAGMASGEGSDDLAELEVVVGGPQDDTILGTSGYNLVYGREGNDLLDGRGGEDTLDASVGSDVCLNGTVYVECENQGVGVIAPQPPTGAAPTEPPVLPD